MSDTSDWSTICIVFMNHTWSVRYCNSLAAPEDWKWQENLLGQRKMYHEDNKNC